MIESNRITISIKLVLVDSNQYCFMYPYKYIHIPKDEFIGKPIIFHIPTEEANIVANELNNIMNKRETKWKPSC